MTDTRTTEDILNQAAQGIIDEYKQTGNPLAPEQEARFRQFVTGLVNSEPPTEEQVWSTIEVAMEEIRNKQKDRALQATNFLMLQFIAACDEASGAFQYVPILGQVKEALKTGLFDQAEQNLMTFLAKCREAAQAV
jgi:hypothetical protein